MKQNINSASGLELAFRSPMSFLVSGTADPYMDPVFSLISPILYHSYLGSIAVGDYIVYQDGG